jgi:hypothetical protein
MPHHDDSTPLANAGGRRSVVINGVRLSDDLVTRLEQSWGVRIQDASYWYDQVSGAWGLEGGPCAGFIPAGLALGGRLRADASHGNTGVVVNGRVLHMLDVLALQRLGPVFPGRYWVDAQGNFGFEGGPRLGNLVAAARAASGAAAGGGAWTVESRFGTVGGDGSGFLYFNDGKTSWSN